MPCDRAIEQATALTATGAKRTHLHLDLDVHDPSVLQANRYATPGGPSPEQVRPGGLRHRAVAARLTGMTITAYDPAFDPGKKMPAAVKALLVDFLAALEMR